MQAVFDLFSYFRELRLCGRQAACLMEAGLLATVVLVSVPAGGRPLPWSYPSEIGWCLPGVTVSCQGSQQFMVKSLP